MRQAAVRPLLVTLGDAHWSDPDSLTLAVPSPGVPADVIATARPWPATAMTSAQDLAAQRLAEVTSLTPLSTIAARELLCCQVAAEVSREVVNQALELRGGNPLLLEQVALEVRRAGRLPQGQVWFSRFVGVGEAERRYLQAASVLGTRFRVAVAMEVAGSSAAEAATELDGLFRGGLGCPAFSG